MPCSYLSNTLPVKSKTHSISQVPLTRSDLTPANTNLGGLDPSTSLPPPKKYYDRVATVHESGGYGSLGYRAPWSDAESRKLLLRTHTTASSAAMLWKLAAKCRGEEFDEETEGVIAGEVTAAKKEDGFRPAKLFSIDRVFRNETMDATHLAEFHQVEGVVADRNLTLADLIGGFFGGYFYLPFPRLIPYLRFHASLLQEDGDREPQVQTRL